MADVIEKSISTFVEKQFPSFYRDEGPVFVAFVKEYYKWLEQKTKAAKSKDLTSWVKVSSTNNQVVGVNTVFSNTFSNGDSIAIYRDNHYYDIFTINAISNNTLLTLVETPNFSNSKTNWAHVDLERNTLYDSRRFLEYDNVDTTLDEFIVHFKEKYLTGIQFDTNTNIRMLLKHSLDLYRAKGTPESLDLLFRIVFGTDIDVYFPGDDLFKVSDGEWIVPKYLEISPSDVSSQFVGKQIVGVSSNATAFVDRSIRRRVNSRISDILYISSIYGTFQTNELIDFSNDPKLDPSQRPTVVGSLTSILIDSQGTGGNFQVGDLLDVSSTMGSGAVGRVSGTVNTSGVLSYTLSDGGYGYEANTPVVFSDVVVIISNTQVDQTLNPWVSTYAQQFETITQPVASIAYNAATGSFVTGGNVYTYSANVVAGTGKVLSVTSTNSTTGSLIVSLISGNLNSTNIYTTGNAVSANVTTYLDETATANVLGQAANLIITVSDLVTSFSVGQMIYQFDSTNSVSATANIQNITSAGSNVSMIVNNANGVFIPNKSICDGNAVVTGNLTNISVMLGLKVTSNSNFTSLDGNYIQTSTSNTRGMITSISQGSGGSFTVNTIVSSETININTDTLNSYMNVYINATSYGFPANTTANQSSQIAPCLTNTNITIGKIGSLGSIFSGTNYTAAPIIIIRDAYVAPYGIDDYALDITGGTAFFKAGEEVTQSATGARGVVRPESNTSTLILERMNFNEANAFVVTSNTTTQIFGGTTGATANVTEVHISRRANQIGFDAIVDDTLSLSNGSITSVDLIDSGFGFVDGEQVTLSKNDNMASGFAVCETNGKGKGYYRRKGGFLSDQKKLHDGYYYQAYSYDILSSVALDKYKEMLKSIVHVAGTKNFATYVSTTKVSSELNTLGAIVTIQ